MESVRRDIEVEVLERGAFTPKAEEIFQLSKEIANSMHAEFVGTEHFILAIIVDGDNLAMRIINTIGANVRAIYSELLLAIGEDVNEYKEIFGGILSKKRAAKANGSFVDKYSKDLTAMAKEVGRDVSFSVCLFVVIAPQR